VSVVITQARIRTARQGQRAPQLLAALERTEFQVIHGQDGQPAFVLVPHGQVRRMKGGLTHGTVPNEVVNHPSLRRAGAYDRIPIA
jgi:hypothetical protein